jgi:alpha-beta hydrolase superfamily lysophospholipase
MMLEAAFTSGAVAMIVVAVMLSEALLLRRHMRKLPVIAWGLSAGACLAMALWAALSQQSWPVVAGCLLLSLVFHLLEVRQWLSLAHRT